MVMTADTNQKPDCATVSKATAPPRLAPNLPCYLAVMRALDARRAQLGWDADALDRAAGKKAGTFARATQPELVTDVIYFLLLQPYIDLLFPLGFDVAIRALKPSSLVSGRHGAKIAEMASRLTDREYHQKIGKLGASRGGVARAKQLSKRRLREIGLAGARARWRRPKLEELTGEAADLARAAAKKTP
jgi:hypothetical protein